MAFLVVDDVRDASPSGGTRSRRAALGAIGVTWQGGVRRGGHGRRRVVGVPDRDLRGGRLVVCALGLRTMLVTGGERPK